MRTKQRHSLMSSIVEWFVGSYFFSLPPCLFLSLPHTSHILPHSHSSFFLFLFCGGERTLLFSLPLILNLSLIVISLIHFSLFGLFEGEPGGGVGLGGRDCNEFFGALTDRERGRNKLWNFRLLSSVLKLHIGDGSHRDSLFISMDFDAGIPISRATVTEGPSSLDQETLWEMNLRSGEAIDSGAYPVREGEPDCSYYIRTGLCRYGATCRFNHPPNRKLAIATTRMRGEYPERIGQPECQYYLKTGTCKFGATCKFHHPREKAGIEGRVTLNILGYPLRPNEIDCAYYLRTGHCKFGNTCKFHHPQPANMMVSVRGSPVYPPVTSPTNPAQLSYPMSRTSFVPSPRWQGPPNYAPMLLPQGMVSVPGWNVYSGQIGSGSSNGSQQKTAVNDQTHGSLHQSEGAIIESQGLYSSYRSASLPVGYYALQSEAVFPERPGEPECQFYMKTGDCKFGAVCKFHHPRERIIPAPDCVLSPIGLPLRPGEPLCIFYSRYGICKFGPSCKFDHPMGVFTYNLPSTSAEASAARNLLGSSSSASGALTLASEGLVEATTTSTRLLGHGDSSIEPKD